MSGPETSSAKPTPEVLTQLEFLHALDRTCETLDDALGLYRIIEQQAKSIGRDFSEQSDLVTFLCRNLTPVNANRKPTSIRELVTDEILPYYYDPETGERVRGDSHGPGHLLRVLGFSVVIWADLQAKWEEVRAMWDTIRNLSGEERAERKNALLAELEYKVGNGPFAEMFWQGVSEASEPLPPLEEIIDYEVVALGCILHDFWATRLIHSPRVWLEEGDISEGMIRDTFGLEFDQFSSLAMSRDKYHLHQKIEKMLRIIKGHTGPRKRRPQFSCLSELVILTMCDCLDQKTMARIIEYMINGDWSISLRVAARNAQRVASQPPDGDSAYKLAGTAKMIDHLIREIAIKITREVQNNTDKRIAQEEQQMAAKSAGDFLYGFGAEPRY